MEPQIKFVTSDAWHNVSSASLKRRNGLVIAEKAAEKNPSTFFSSALVVCFN